MNQDNTTYLIINDRGILCYNAYVYCQNNPVKNKDTTGNAVETVFDVASLGVSIIEVALNPGDVWAWAGLVGDAIDLVPFVTGVGEITRAMKATKKITETASSVIDTAKSTKRITDTSVGSYEIIFKSGKNYVGKGSFDRAVTSAIEHSNPNILNGKIADEVVSIRWRAAADDATAFVEEYALQTYRGVANPETYNRIWSPGKKIYINR